MIRIAAVVLAVLALFVGTAGTATAAKPPKSTVYSSPAVPLVDDDGVTRPFFVSYNFTDGTTTCNYAVWGNATPNPDDGNLPIPEGYHQTTGTTVAPNQAAAIEYCKSVFPDRTRVPNDPTP